MRGQAERALARARGTVPGPYGGDNHPLRIKKRPPRHRGPRRRSAGGVYSQTMTGPPGRGPWHEHGRAGPRGGRPGCRLGLPRAPPAGWAGTGRRGGGPGVGEQAHREHANKMVKHRTTRTPGGAISLDSTPGATEPGGQRPGTAFYVRAVPRTSSLLNRRGHPGSFSRRCGAVQPAEVGKRSVRRTAMSLSRRSWVNPLRGGLLRAPRAPAHLRSRTTVGGQLVGRRRGKGKFSFDGFECRGRAPDLTDAKRNRSSAAGVSANEELSDGWRGGRTRRRSGAIGPRRPASRRRWPNAGAVPAGLGFGLMAHGGT